MVMSMASRTRRDNQPFLMLNVMFHLLLAPATAVSREQMAVFCINEIKIRSAEMQLTPQLCGTQEDDED